MTWKDFINPFKTTRQFLLTGVPISIAIAYLFMDGFFASLKGFSIGFVWSYTIWITQSLGIGFVFALIDKKYTWMEKPVQRGILGIIGLVIASVVLFLIVQYIFGYIFYDNAINNFWRWVWLNSRVVIVISFLIAVTLSAIEFLKSWRRSAIEAAELKAEMGNYKYESLRKQVNPHFLFNSLNVLTDLVYEDQEKAVKFIRQLSSLYRYVLDSQQSELVPLKKELDFIDQFNFLLETRFEDKLEIENTLTCNSDELIVPVALQILVENAVKHNEVSKAQPLKIKLFRKENRLFVENVLQVKRSTEKVSGMGLDNLRKRYSHFSDENIEIVETKEKYLVSLPILKQDYEGINS